MATPYASEFTPELTAQSLAALLNPIEENERAEVGAARREGAAGGLVGQAATGSRIGAAVNNAGQNEESAVAGFNQNVAKAQYGERMTDESEAFQDTERQKTEAFQTSMAALGYQFADSQRVNQNRADKISGEQGLVEGAGLNLLSKGLGNALGGSSGGGGGGPGAGAGSFDPSAGYGNMAQNFYAGEFQ